MREAGINNREQRDRQFTLLSRRMIEIAQLDLSDPEMEPSQNMEPLINAGVDAIALLPEDGTEARSREPFMQRLEDSFARAA